MLLTCFAKTGKILNSKIHLTPGAQVRDGRYVAKCALLGFLCLALGL